MTTEPRAGSAVSPGQTVKIILRWDRAARPDGELHKAIGCVAVGGVLDAGLSVEERPTANDGVFEAEYAVPDVPAGTELCNFGFLSDDSGGHGYSRSETLCFAVGDAHDEEAAAAAPPPTAVPPGGAEPEPDADAAGDTRGVPAPPVAVPPSPTAAPAEVAAPAPSASPAPPPEVMGEVLEASELPRTGPGQTGLVLTGAALALGGLAFVVSPGRRR